MALGNAHRAQNPSTRRQHRPSDTTLEPLQCKCNTADHEQHQGEYQGIRSRLHRNERFGRSLWGELTTTTSTAHRIINLSLALSFKSRGAISTVIEALLAPDGLTLQGAIGRQLTSRHKKAFSLCERKPWHNRSSVWEYIITSTADRRRRTLLLLHLQCKRHVSCPYPAVVKQNVMFLIAIKVWLLCGLLSSCNGMN